MLEEWIDYLTVFATRAPWLVLALAALPMVIAAKLRRTFPSPFAAALMLLPFLLSLLVVIAPDFLLVVLLADAIVALVLVTDFWLAPGPKDFKASREMQRAASLAVPHPVKVILDYRGRFLARAVIRDDVPQGAVIEPAEHVASIPPLKRWEGSHLLSVGRRGAYKLEFVYIRVESALRLWQRYIKVPCVNTLNVYPDMKQVAEYAILARSNRLSLIGVRRTRKIGQDSDFERLRDYTLDDNYKFIDWRSTARRNKLTVKDFQSDQSQRVVFMLDCGRMMTNQYQGLSLVDYSLNSLLMLSHVALSQNDAVGLVCFSDKVDRYVPPRSGRSQMNQILHAGFDRFPALVESRFDQAFLHLSSNLRKRSLVVLITSIIDQVNADQIVAYLGNLQQRHLPLLVCLRDHRIFDAADNPASDPDVLYRSAAAASILTWREQVLHRLRMQGILVVDAFPEQLTSPLINEYLRAKAKHLL